MSPSKIDYLFRHYRDAHFALAKWDTPLGPFIDIVQEAIEGPERDVPFDPLCFSQDSAKRFINDRGNNKVSHADIGLVRLGGGDRRETR